MPPTRTPFRRVRALWPDHLGLARGKVLDASVLDAPEPGTGHCRASFALGLDREMVPYEASGILEGLPDLRAVFDPAAVRPGWPPGSDLGVVVADLEVPRAPEAPVAPGAPGVPVAPVAPGVPVVPVARSPRALLKKAISQFTADALHPVVGIELEAFLLQPSPDGPGYRPLDTPGHRVYGAGPLADPPGVFDRVLEAADAAGIVVESFHGEYDEGQFELTLQKKEALAAADEAFLLRLLAREVAAAAGFHLTFLGKPFTDRGGCGLHVNLSLETEVETGIEEATAAAGPPDGTPDGTPDEPPASSPADSPAAGNRTPARRNAFADPEGPDGLAPVAWRALAGLLHHHAGLAAVLAPTVNAYRRLRPGQMSGYYANWGRDHRGVAVRVPPERGAAARLEHRLADGACGAHIAVAAVLLAARLGIERGADPPPAETADCVTTPSKAPTVAPDLAAALDDLEADRELVAALGEDFVRMHCAVKRAEWERYRAHTSDWELREYLPHY